MGVVIQEHLETHHPDHPADEQNPKAEGMALEKLMVCISDSRTSDGTYLQFVPNALGLIADAGSSAN